MTKASNNKRLAVLAVPSYHWVKACPPNPGPQPMIAKRVLPHLPPQKVSNYRSCTARRLTTWECRLRWCHCNDSTCFLHPSPGSCWRKRINIRMYCNAMQMCVTLHAASRCLWQCPAVLKLTTWQVSKERKHELCLCYADPWLMSTCGERTPTYPNFSARFWYCTKS